MLAIPPTLFAKIALRLVAVYLLYQGLIHLAGLLALPHLMESVGADRWAIAHLAVATTMPVVAGLVLWIAASPLARLVVGQPREHEGAATAIQIQAVAISTAGLLLLFAAVPRFVSNFYHAVIQAPQLDGVRYYSDSALGYLLGAGLQVFLGLVLIVGAGFFPRLLWRIRAFGVSKGG
jgi:hypothetical protein